MKNYLSTKCNKYLRFIDRVTFKGSIEPIGKKKNYFFYNIYF